LGWAQKIGNGCTKLGDRELIKRRMQAWFLIKDVGVVFRPKAQRVRQQYRRKKGPGIGAAEG